MVPRPISTIILAAPHSPHRGIHQCYSDPFASSSIDTIGRDRQDADRIDGGYIPRTETGALAYPKASKERCCRSPAPTATGWIFTAGGVDSIYP